jgi:hypothetical protein
MARTVAMLVKSKRSAAARFAPGAFDGVVLTGQEPAGLEYDSARH